MLTEEQVGEILRALNSLPPEKVAEACDFILFLQAQHERKLQIDESDAWTDEDLQDFSSASLRYAEGSLPSIGEK